MSFVVSGVEFVCLLSQVRGVRSKVQNKTRSAAGINFICVNLFTPLVTYLLTVSVVFLILSLVVVMMSLFSNCCDVVRREDV